MFQRLSAALRRGTEVAMMVLMAFLVVVVVVSVIFRYVLLSPLGWSEEVGRYVMIWLGFLGASLAVHQGMHVGVGFVVNAVPARLAVWLRGLARAGVGAFLLIVMLYGFHLVANLWDQVSPVLEIRMTWPYLAIPVGSLLMLIQLATLVTASHPQDG
ncbi:MAG TPA: TRAP transporter small permease [Candidatus Methylomirabilis sp.]|nr:TRAP transporter small permease [Candidatus Methylomirabilis sp.]